MPPPIYWPTKAGAAWGGGRKAGWPATPVSGHRSETRSRRFHYPPSGRHPRGPASSRTTGGWGEVGAAGKGSPQPLVPGRLACHRLSRPQSPRWVCEPGFHQGLCCRVVGSRGRGHMRAEQGERKCSRAEKPPNSDTGLERARWPCGGSGTETPLRWVPGGVRRAPRGGPQPGAGPGAPSSRPPALSWGARRGMSPWLPRGSLAQGL